MHPHARHAAILCCFVLLTAARQSLATEQYLFVSKWGYRDVVPGAFNYAYALDVDRFGNVYVADQLNQRVQKFTSSGAFVTLWGGSGAGPGLFNIPSGIAVDTTGYVYVADQSNFRIQKFTTGGTYVSQWGDSGSADGEFYTPAKVAADHFGNVYTCEGAGMGPTGTPLNNRIQKFTNTGAFLSKWSGITSDDDVAVDPSGNVFVMDLNAVVKYASTGTYLTQWGSLGSGPGQFRYPLGLGVDKHGNVYVADSQNNRIQKFTNNGAFLAQWGSLGSGDGQFRFPCDVAVDDSDNVYVTDTNNFRIQKFRRDIPSVLFVHGICGDSSSWSTYEQELSNDGFDVHNIQYGSPDYSLRPAAYVAKLAEALDAIPAPHVAVVAHSMGGLITREYMRRQALSGRTSKVTQLVTLGTPYHGSDLLADLVARADAVDAACSLPGLPPCHASELLSHFVGACLTSRYSRPALYDLEPGSWYLNRLNYESNPALVDASGSHGWSPHQPEALPANVYFASIGGTGSICDPTVRSWFWSEGSTYHPSDGTVSTGSAILTKSTAFRSTDVGIPFGTPLAHSVNSMTNCHPAYYSSSSFAQKVASILSGSPAAPPVMAPEFFRPGEEIEASPEDSLRSLPAIVDNVAAGQLAVRGVVVPATSLLSVLLLSTDAHLSLQTPDGSFITPSDTSVVNGISFFEVGDSGGEGFQIAHPASGAWNVRVDATASLGAQDFVCLVSVASSTEVRVTTASKIAPGDSLRVRAEMSDAGVPRSDVTWTCRIIGPDDVTTALALFDDGAHGDSLPGDGRYGNVVLPGGGVGSYRILASATAPGSAPFVASTQSEVAEVEDLVVQPADISLSRNVAHAGDTLVVSAVVHNQSATPAMGVGVEIRDRRTGALLGGSSVDIAGSSSVIVQAPWIVAAPDTHSIQVLVSPYVVDEVNFTNNSAERSVVLGTLLGVEPAGTSGALRFGPPRPNPASGGTTLDFSSPVRTSAALDILDVLGRRVRRWTWSSLEPGIHSVTWDGRDERGSRVAPGVYLCRLEAQGQVLRRKVVLRP